MRRNTSRILAIVLTAALLITSFAGCTSSSGNSTTAATTAAAGSTTKAATTAAAPVVEDPVEISYVSWSCGEYEAETWIEDYIEGELNIELDVMKVDLSNSQARDLMLASDEFPDCGWLLVGAKTMEDNGLIRTIPEDMIRTYAPHFAAEYDNSPNGWSLNLNDDGEKLSLCGILADNLSAQNAEFYRLDWLQAIGMEPRGELVELSDRLYLGFEPFTNEEFLQIMEKFTTEDPDGDGVDDTFGMVGCPSSASWLSMIGIRWRFGSYNGICIDENGTIQYDFVTKKYQDYLRTFSTLYKNGYVDPEYLTLSFAEMNEKLNQGIGGYVVGSWSFCETWAADRAPLSVLAFDPEATYVALPFEYDYTTTFSPVSSSYNFYVNRKVDDEKLAKILEFVDFSHFAEDEETWMKTKYGEQGTHWEYLEPETKTAPVLLEGMTNGNTGSTIFNTSYVRPESSLFWVHNVSNESKILSNYRFNEYMEYMKYHDVVDLYGVLDRELSQQYWPSINVINEEFFYGVLSGEKDIDADWEQYLADLENAGYDKIRENYQQLPPFEDYINGAKPE